MVDTEPMLALEQSGSRTVQRKRSMTYMSLGRFHFSPLVSFRVCNYLHKCARRVAAFRAF